MSASDPRNVIDDSLMTEAEFRAACRSRREALFSRMVNARMSQRACASQADGAMRSELESALNELRDDWCGASWQTKADDIPAEWIPGKYQGSEVSPRSSGGSPNPIFAVVRADGSVVDISSTRENAEAAAIGYNASMPDTHKPYRAETLYPEAQVSALRQEAATLTTLIRTEIENSAALRVDLANAEARVVTQRQQIEAQAEDRDAALASLREIHAVLGDDVPANQAKIIEAVRQAVGAARAHAQVCGPDMRRSETRIDSDVIAELSAARQEAETLREQMQDALAVLVGGPTAADARRSPVQRVMDAQTILRGAARVAAPREDR